MSEKENVKKNILESKKEKIKGINYASFSLKQKIIQDISLEDLPPVLVKYILLDIINDITILEQEIIKKEQHEYNNEKEKEK